MEIFYVEWQKYNKEKTYKIGYLIFDDKWYFRYNINNIYEAIENGFRPFPDMPDIKKIYKNQKLLPVFENRYNNINNMENSSGVLLTDKILIKHEGKGRYAKN